MTECLHKIKGVAVSSGGARLALGLVTACVILLALSTSAHAAISFIKNVGRNNSKTVGASISVTVPAAGVAAGNSVIVTFAMDSDSGAVSCSDSKSNTYLIDADVGRTGDVSNVRTVICSAHNVTALVSGDTITVNHPSITARAMSVFEFSGLAPTYTLDVTSTATGTGTNPSSGTAETTVQADELLIGAIGVEGPIGDSFTAGTGWTGDDTNWSSGTTGGGAGTNITINPEYQIVSATGNYAATGTITSRDWATALASYKDVAQAFVPAGAGKALSFDAVDNYVSVAQHASLTPTNITVEAWVNATAFTASSWNVIVMKPDALGNWNEGYGLNVQADAGGNGTLQFWITNWSIAGNRAEASIGTGTRIHVAGTYDGSNIRLYINGELVATTANAAGITHSGDPLEIGRGVCCLWNGLIDEVRVWDVARSQTQIRDSMHDTQLPTNTNLVAYWKFDQAWSTQTGDSSGNGNNGTLNGMTLSSDWIRSTMPEGTDGKFVATVSATSVGPSGGTMTATITSTPDDANNLGIYQFGDLTGRTVTTSDGESFPAGFVSRSNITWGAVERGAVTADLVFDYLGHRGINSASNVEVCERDNADDTSWTEVTETSRDDTNRTITLSGVTVFDKEYALCFKVAPTAVTLMSFTATSHDDVVLLRWRTGYEVDNLGFYLYREENGQLIQLTPSLVAGSALFAGAKTELTAGRSYMWWDLPESFAGLRYWLEDVDLNGQRNWYGPVEVGFSGFSHRLSASEQRQAQLLSKLGNGTHRLAHDAQRLALRTQRSARTRQNWMARRGVVSGGARSPLDVQWALAAQPAVKLFIQEEGWYRVGQPELVAAGLDSRVNPRFLQLFVNGEEQPIVVVGERDGRFDSNDAIEFYGIGLDTPSTDTRVYWLVVGSRPGKRIRAEAGLSLQHSVVSSAESFPLMAEWKPRTVYFAALRNGDAENFFGPLISMEPLEQALTVHHLDPNANREALLEVVLQGVTNVTHQVRVSLNGIAVGWVVFNGQQKGIAKIPISQAALRSGENLVALAAAGGDVDVSLVDVIRLTYWHTLTADQDTLWFTVPGNQQVTVGGFSSPQIRVVDITNRKEVEEVVGQVAAQGGGYAVTLRASGHGQRTLLAFTEARAKRPAEVIANEPSAWHQGGQGADYVIISHGDFLQSVEPLRALRNGVVIDVEDLYDEFSFGAKSPQALRDFLVRAKQQWRIPPRFALLVGDASVDPRNYLGLGEFDFVPTRLVDTLFLETASDDWFVDFKGNGLPQMAVGRLPVRTAEEAITMVSKITGYEQSGGNWRKEALVVADNNDIFDFETASSQLDSLIPADIAVHQVFRGRTDVETARREILDRINQGQLIVNYMGHGSVEVWAGEGLLTSADVRGLSNRDRLPFFVAMTCLNGLFHDVFTESLAEALMKAEGGAVAVWAPSGASAPAAQTMMNQELFRLLFSSKSLTIGEAIIQAKAGASDTDVRRTWILFGDPATRIK